MKISLMIIRSGISGTPFLNLQNSWKEIQMNSKTIQKIKQQEATIEMISQLLNAKRARPEKLEAAVNELNRLKSELVESTTEKPTATARRSRLVTAIQKDVSGDIFALNQSALSQEASRLRRDQAELSNMRHKVSPE